jgi:carboxyl-terminal processing protease
MMRRVKIKTMAKDRPTQKRLSPGSTLQVLAGALIVVLALYSFLPQVGATVSSQAYAQLRLLVEALYEIDGKYVTEKKDRELIYGAIRGMVASLDPNSAFLSPSEYQESQHGVKQPEADAGMELSLKDNLLTVIAPSEGGPAWKAGLQADDHILKINNQSTRTLSPLEAAKKLQGPPGTRVKVQIVRTGFVKPQDLELTLERNTLESVTYYPLEDGYSYIRLRTPRERSAQELQQVLRTIQAGPGARKGIILDLRNTAGGQLEEARRLASAFVGNDPIYSVKGRQADKKQSYNGIKEYQIFNEKVPLVVLVDQGTARAAEVIAGALQTQYGAVLLGYKTFGDCAIPKVFPLKDGSALIVSIGYCYTPRDHLIQGKGLEPDISGPKKDPDDKSVTESSVKVEKPKKIPDANEVMQDPLVRQALSKLKNWSKSSFSLAPETPLLRKKQVVGPHPADEEIS